MSNFWQFISWEKTTRDTIDFKRAYVDMAGDLIAGLLLSQIVYWHLPDNSGQSKLRAELDGHLWIARNRDDWWDEIRITAKQVDRALKILEEKGLIIRKNSLFAGKRTPFIRLNPEGFMDVWNTQTEGNTGIDQRVTPDVTERSIPITETTTETTTEKTPSAGDERPAEPANFQEWLDAIEESQNRQAVLVRMHETLYPGRSPPGFSYMAKVARKFGAARLAQLLWELSTRPPVGDVLAFIQAVEGKKKTAPFGQAGNGRSAATKPPPSIEQQHAEAKSIARFEQWQAADPEERARLNAMWAEEYDREERERENV